MNRNSVSKAAAVICALIVVAAFTLGVGGIIGFALGNSDNADGYTAGEAVITKPVKNLDIQWTSGTVDIAYHDEDTVTLTEKSQKTLREDEQMQWKLDGDTLRVRYNKETFSLFSFTVNESKDLTLTLPTGTVLKNAAVSSVSGMLNIPSIEAETLTLDTTSGEIFAEGKAQKINIDSTSGKVQLNLTGNAEEISADTTSGDIHIEAEDAEQIRAESTSGDIHIEAEEVEQIRAESTSTDIYVMVKDAGSLYASSTSGDVTVFLPEEPGFTAKLETTSGKIDYDLPLSKQGSAYICGDGSRSVKIDTTSGDIMVLSNS